MKYIALGATFSLLATLAHADISARFIEGAPKDRFEITSMSDCLVGPVSVSIDLEGSAGGLIFDTTDKGAGVEVFQPFELVKGSDIVTRAPMVLDGDTALSLDLSMMPKGQTVAFTLDVDDTGGAREITVSGAEIEGAKVILQTAEGATSALFGSDARASLEQSGCSS